MNAMPYYVQYCAIIIQFTYENKIQFNSILSSNNPSYFSCL
jgi:hypothetical protein